MQIARFPIDHTCPERDIWRQMLPLDGKRILELGCGRAELTRAIAGEGQNRSVAALEVDERQHRINLTLSDLPNVQFARGGAEAIPYPDGSFDVVLMFKSLHHVPVAEMAAAMREIARVLTPDGLAYISEPIYAGAFNEILRMFHDEEQVRRAAFAAVQQAVDSGLFALVEERFFNTPMHFADFAEFEQKVIGATHSDHRLTSELHAEVSARFGAHVGPDGAHFAQPMRVDLLRKVR